MPSTYANNLRLENIANGEQSGSWGDTTNKNICSLLVDSITAVTTVSITGLANYILSANAGTTDESRTAVLKFTGSLAADCTITAPPVAKTYLIDNYTNFATGGNKNVIIKTLAGVGATVPFGKYTVYCDGLDFFFTGFSANGGVINGNAATTGNFIAGNNLTALGSTTLATTLTGALVGTAGVVSAVAPGTAGNILMSNGTAWTSLATAVVNTVSGGTTGLTPATATSGAVVLAGTLAVANGGTGSTTSTGTGAVVRATSPTLVTPALGTPSGGVLTNCTGSALALNAGLGTNQTWSQPSRGAGTRYYNTTGRAIAVSITTGVPVHGATTYLYVGDLSSVDHLAVAFEAYSDSAPSFAIIPAGFSYYETGGASISFWAELR